MNFFAFKGTLKANANIGMISLKVKNMKYSLSPPIQMSRNIHSHRNTLILHKDNMEAL